MAKTKGKSKTKSAIQSRLRRKKVALERRLDDLRKARAILACAAIVENPKLRHGAGTANYTLIASALAYRDGRDQAAIGGVIGIAAFGQTHADHADELWNAANGPEDATVETEEAALERCQHYIEMCLDDLEGVKEEIARSKDRPRRKK